MEMPEAAVVPRDEEQSVLLAWCLLSSKPHWHLMLHLPSPVHTFSGAVQGKEVMNKKPCPCWVSLLRPTLDKTGRQQHLLLA